ncbi:MAG: ECF transporter S component, partial [Firmicutes bacterium]|nr:ECF transporter S component [Bacillota bacterium]
MGKLKTQHIVYTALGAALVLVATQFLAFALPSGAGYINLGDSVILMLSFLFGPIVGGVAGGLGSMTADLLGGYAVYAPFSAVIKFLEGVLAGLLTNRFKKIYWRQLGAYFASGSVVLFGYFWADLIFFDAKIALLGVLFNLVQIVVSILVVSLLYKPLFR